MNNQLQKYDELVQSLQHQDQDTYFQKPIFYFKYLQKLEIDLIIAEKQILQQKRKMAVLEDRLRLIRLEQRRSDIIKIDAQGDSHRINQQSEQQVCRQLVCGQKGCDAVFERESSLKLHCMLVHNINLRWKPTSNLIIQLDGQEKQC